LQHVATCSGPWHGYRIRGTAEKEYGWIGPRATSSVSVRAVTVKTLSHRFAYRVIVRLVRSTSDRAIEMAIGSGSRSEPERRTTGEHHE